MLPNTCSGSTTLSKQPTRPRHTITGVTSFHSFMSTCRPLHSSRQRGPAACLSPTSTSVVGIIGNNGIVERLVLPTFLEIVATSSFRHWRRLELMWVIQTWMEFIARVAYGNL